MVSFNHPNDYPWKPGIDSIQKINVINKIMKDYAKKNGMVYLDYYSSMADDENGLSLGKNPVSQRRISADRGIPKNTAARGLGNSKCL